MDPWNLHHLDLLLWRREWSDTRLEREYCLYHTGMPDDGPGDSYRIGSILWVFGNLFLTHTEQYTRTWLVSSSLQYPSVHLSLCLSHSLIQLTLTSCSFVLSPVQLSLFSFSDFLFFSLLWNFFYSVLFLFKSDLIVTLSTSSFSTGLFIYLFLHYCFIGFLSFVQPDHSFFFFLFFSLFIDLFRVTISSILFSFFFQTINCFKPFE